MCWYRVPLWDLRPDIISCRNVAVWNLRYCIYWAPALTRGWVCNLKCNHWIVQVAQNPKPYFTVSSETPPTWSARFPYLYPPGTGWPSYTTEHWVPFTSSLTTRLLRIAWLRWRYSSPPLTWMDRSLYIQPSGIGRSSPKSSQCQSQSHVTADGQSISMSWCLVHSALKGFHPKNVNSTSGSVH
jgi:hypothetical protein